MESEQHQKELFEFEKPKKSFRRLGNLFQKTSLENRYAITLTLEKIIFILIGIIMFMVVLYALGVEMGKSLQREAAAVVGQAVSNKLTAPQLKTPMPHEKALAQPVKAKIAAQEKAIVTPAMTPVIITAQRPASTTPYTIIALTLSQKGAALTEVNRLRQAGLGAYMYQSNSYYQVCVGAYAKKENAQATLNKVRRIFKDAYIKSRL